MHCFVDVEVDRKPADDVTVTSPSTEPTRACASLDTQVGSAVGPPLVTGRPTDMASSGRDVDGRRLTGDVTAATLTTDCSEGAQQRRPLAVLLGSPMTSTGVQTVADAARPWRPFSVHEDQQVCSAPTWTTAATAAAAESTVNRLDQPHHHHGTATTSFLSVIPFVPVLPDGGLYSQLAVSQLRQLGGSVGHQVVDAAGGFLYPTAVTGYAGGVDHLMAD